ncbi:MAG TPA: hypothetical protein VJS91_00890 [Nitrososphaeraceae archaeon]|nr:hypothetical protein [Nitrososphaeraceae archaeon]
MTADYFRLHLPDYDSILVQNQSALERFMLLLLGLNLKTGDDSTLDIEYSAQVFGKGIEIIGRFLASRAQPLVSILKTCLMFQLLDSLKIWYFMEVRTLTRG